MQEESRQIIDRFFEALNALKDRHDIRGKATFARKYGIDRQNMYKLEKGIRSWLPAVWLQYIVKDYHVSAHWLLTGEGEMFFFSPKRKK